MKEEHNCIDLNRTKAHVEEFGLSVVRVESTEYLPSFAYSIGLWETYKHPEIICFGLRPQALHEIINDVAEIIKVEGKVDLKTEYKNIFKDSRAAFLMVDLRNVGDYFGVAIQYYDSIKFDALQLVWTDRNNKFPWEKGFEKEFRYFQPLLDRNAKFKFREEKTLGIFTTRQWLEDEKPILRVAHDHDGDWQFLTKEIDFENGKVVALEQMIFKDETLNDVFDLEYGEEAEREFVGGHWTRSEVGPEEN